MRINQSHDFLSSYVHGVISGDIGIAAFQRPFRWTRHDVEQFMQSVTDALPIGSFLLWSLTEEQRNSGLLSKGRVGPVEHGTEVRTLLLDGQNRLSSLIWAARITEAPADPAYPYSEEERQVWLSGWTLVADIEERRMHFVRNASARSSKRYPLGVLLSSLRARRALEVMADMTACGIADSDLNWFLDTVPNFFRTKKTVIAEISNATADEAWNAYMRICRTGQPISDDDMDIARAWMLQLDRGQNPVQTMNPA